MLVLVLERGFEVDRQHAGRHQRNGVSVRDSLALDLMRKLGILGPLVCLQARWQHATASSSKCTKSSTVGVCRYLARKSCELYPRVSAATSNFRSRGRCPKPLCLDLLMVVSKSGRGVKALSRNSFLHAWCRPADPIPTKLWAVMHSVANVSDLHVQGLQNLQKPNTASLAPWFRSCNSFCFS